MNTRLLFTFLFGVLLTSALRAQTPGDSCQYAIYLGASDDTTSSMVSDDRIDSWYSFTATKPDVTITSTSFTSSPGHYEKMVLYYGTCGSLVPVDSMVVLADTIIEMFRQGLAAGLYYVKVSQNFIPGCRTCVPDTVTSNLRIQQGGIPPWCGFDSRNSFLRTSNPGYSVQMTAQDQYIYNYITTHSNIAGPFTIPVVVHVIHYGDAYGSGNNISYDQILWQIAGLNAAFQHDYANYNMEGYGHTYSGYGPQDYSSNPQVRFCLAERGRDSALNVIPFFFNTMSGDTECGIMRYDLTNPMFSTITNIDSLNSYNITNVADEQTLLDVTRPGTEFPADMYLNIYLVPEICETVNSVTSCGVIGIGTMGTFNSLTGQFDGVVFRTDVFGDNSVQGNTFNLFTPLQEGKIMDHEAGHYLSLYHTFQPDSNQPIGCYGMQLPTATSDQCDQHGDFCCDTPPDSDPNVQPYNSVQFLNSCGETYFPAVPANNHRDMNENYMDYSDDDWYNTFTFDQSMRISAMLDVGGPRHSLVTPANLALTGVSDTGICHCCILVAHIELDRDTICIGAPVNFLTPSGNAFCASSWLWTFTGGSPASSTATNPSVTYSATGLYPVYLMATNGVDTVYDSTFVQVIIPSVSITGVNTSDTVCSGNHENIFLTFFGNLPPYNVVIFDQNNDTVAVINNLTADTAIVQVNVNDTSNIFHITSATNGLGCDLDTLGLAVFNVQQCCPNLFKDGEFEDWGAGCTIFPSTTQQATSLNCGTYFPSGYSVHDPTTQYGGWPVVPSTPNINGLSMFIDCWGTAQDCTQTPIHTELWCQSVVLEQGGEYQLQFDFSGHHAAMGNLSPPSFTNNSQLFLQVKVNGVFIGTPVRVPYCSAGTPWHTFTMDWTNPFPTGLDTICLCQVEALPFGDVNFSGGAFDFMIDNLTIRAKDIPTVFAGLDTTICPGGIADIGSLLNDSDGVYVWNPNDFVTCDTCFFTTANPDSTYEYVLINQQNGCIVRDTVIVSVLDADLGPDTSFCGNGSITLSPIVTGNSGNVSYLWQPGMQTTSSITVSPTVPTTYILTVFDSTAGCSDSDTITIYPNNLNVTVNDTTICSGDTITLVSNVTGNIGGVGYLWQPGNQTTSTIAVSPSVVTTYTLIVSDTAGCSDTTTVTVTPDNLGASFSGGTICYGDSITLTSSVSSGYPTFNYLWQPGAQTSSSVTVAPTSNTIYTLTITDSIGCTATRTDTVIVDHLIASLSNAQFCSGDSATLSPSITGGSSPFTYLWQPGSQATASITVAPSSPITYTVTVSDVNGCLDTAVATITPNNLSATLANKTICSGQTTSLAPSVTGGNPLYSYLWLPGSLTTSSINVNPTSTTSFTVIVTDATGCSDTAFATVTVNPAPTVTASANPNPPCYGSFVQLQANVTGTGPFAYSWLPTTNLSNSAISNPTITAFNGTTITYTVFIADALGCSAIDSVQLVVDPNCCAAQSNAPDTLFSGISGGQYAVNQDLYISGNITISGTEMLMAPNVSIIVLSGSTLTITGQSHLHACLQMWKGIILRPGANLVINQNSLIEDAYTAVNYNASTGSVINLVNAIFNKNQFAVLAQNWTGLLGFNMINCRVTCRVLPASPTVASLTPAALTALPQSNLIAPLTTQRAYTGLQFMSGGSVNVGSVGTTNIFDYMDHGIVVSNTNIIIRNNRFQNMLQPCVGPVTCSNNAGTAIIANDLPVIGNATTYNTIVVGGSAAQGNTFTNCWRAIDITRYINTTVKNNVILSNATVINPPNTSNLNGDHGIFIRTNYSITLDVNNNQIRNQATGIHIMLTAGGLPYNTMNVRDNSVIAGATSTTVANRGIQVEGVTLVSFLFNNFLNIEGDTVLRAETCIQVRNIRNSVRIFSNPELFVRPIATVAAGPNQAGIFVQNCQAVLIQDNLNIHSTGTTYSNPNHVNVRGIYVWNCGEPTICNNITKRFGECLVFEGACGNAYVRKNQMQFAYNGFVMRNSAVIGQQGTFTSPMDNQWLGGFVNADTWVQATANVNINSPIYTRPGAPWTPAINLPLGPTAIAPNPASALAPPAVCGPTPQLLAAQILRRNIAQNQIPYAVYPNENRIANQRRLYKELDLHPSLMIGDTILQHFYSNNANTSIGSMHGVENACEQGNVSVASSSNGNISGISLPEYNQHLFNTICINTLMLGIDTLTSAQMADVTAIANQCPNEGGDVVWQARAMLNWVLHTSQDYSDTCSETSSRLQSTTGDAATVYPNPTSGDLTIACNLSKYQSAFFEIIDLTGRTVITAQLTPDQAQQKIAIDGIASGAYVYRIIGDAEIVATDVLIINR